MRQIRLGRAWRFGSLILAVAAAGLLTWSAGQAQPAATPRAPVHADPSDALYQLGFKFQSAATCSSAKCHGAPAGGSGGAGGAAGPPEYKNDSYTLWNQEGTADQPADPHRNAFKSLRGTKGLGIAKVMGIANAAADAKCLSCHALNPPAERRDAQFQVSEGITCNACHGPSGPSLSLPATDPASKGWVELHQQKGWVKSQRTAFAAKHDELLKKFGFYDTRPLVERAQRCVSCHLAIDPQMVAAGHPQPTFELNWFSLTYPNRHWVDPTDKYFGARLWAAGQAVALKEAMNQLAVRAETSGTNDKDVSGAYSQALAHYTVFAPLFSAGGLRGNLNDVVTPLSAARAALTGGAAKRGDLAKSARAAEDAAAKLTASVVAFEPDKASTMKVLTAIVNQPTMADTMGALGIEQQRDAIFALYDAYARSADADPAAGETRDFIGQKLFPIDSKQQLIPAKDLPIAQYKAALGEVKAKLRV